MKPKEILLAEDDADDQEFFEDVTRLRSDVTLSSIARNGEEVISKLLQLNASAQLPDIIVLDQNMPKRNGLQTLLLLKGEATFRHIPVFIYSTYANNTLLQELTEAGAVSFFEKPITPDGYNDMISSMLERI